MNWNQEERLLRDYLNAQKNTPYNRGEYGKFYKSYVDKRDRQDKYDNFQKDHGRTLAQAVSLGVGVVGVTKGLSTYYNAKNKETKNLGIVQTIASAAVACFGFFLK